MKYLKKFTESIKNNSYEEISGEQFDNTVWVDVENFNEIGEQWVGFTSDEFNKISSIVTNIPSIDRLCNSHGIQVKLKNGINSLLTILGYTDRTISEEGNGKYDSYLRCDITYLDGYIIKDFYKCDQTYGLIECIKHILKID